MMNRRSFLHATSLGVGGAVLLGPGVAGAVTRLGAAPPVRLDATVDGDDVPRTGFEEREGESWTTHDEELEFLAEVASRSDRVTLTEIGRSVSGERPLHLVSIGTRARQVAPAAARQTPTVLFVGTQHGNEPAGREAVLIALRDLAFTDDPTLLRQLEDHTILVIPTANPDGRERNIRTNGVTDINRDHLQLTQPEVQAMHRVIRDWSPDIILDHHEYGPSVPVLYDADILYLWPRNLNVDGAVRDLSRTLCEEYIAKGARRSGFTADEYGLYKLGPNEITQTAGNEDPGICRNAVGLRHSLGVLIESAVSQSTTPDHAVGELLSSAANLRRRVESQVQTVVDTLRFMRDQGHVAKLASDEAGPLAATAGADQSRPTYFAGADNDEPSPGDIDDPAALRYRLSTEQVAEHATCSTCTTSPWDPTERWRWDRQPVRRSRCCSTRGHAATAEWAPRSLSTAEGPRASQRHRVRGLTTARPPAAPLIEHRWALAPNRGPLQARPDRRFRGNGPRRAARRREGVARRGAGT
jgi:hypothetical protein